MKNLFLNVINMTFFFLLSLTFVQAQCDHLGDDEYWYIDEEYGSIKISDCHSQANYNCHGFVLAYLEDGCQPSGPVTPPYTCPNSQGIKDTGSITNNDKYLEVCNTSQCDIVTYDIGGTYGIHSAVKASIGGNTKYMSKYGTEGPIVAHELEGSWYHYILSPTIHGYWAYIGIAGNPTITGTGNVTFSVNSIDNVTYSWSITSGSSNIYIYSGSNQNSVILKPTHSGSAVLRLHTVSACGESTQTLNLTIDTQICLEGTYTNAGSGPYNLNSANNVSPGSVMTTVACPNASSYSWERKSGSLPFYASGPEMSFTMTSGSSVSFEIKAKNSEQQVIGTRNVAYYNYGYFMAYPNPAKSYFDIEVADDIELNILVFDEYQQKLREIKNYKPKSKIDISNWERGIYILHIYKNSQHVKEQRLRIE